MKPLLSNALYFNFSLTHEGTTMKYILFLILLKYLINLFYSSRTIEDSTYNVWYCNVTLFAHALLALLGHGCLKRKQQNGKLVEEDRSFKYSNSFYFTQSYRRICKWKCWWYDLQTFYSYNKNYTKNSSLFLVKQN